MLKVEGDLRRRMLKNYERLTAKEYRSPGLFAEGGAWPGDWQGRAMLALACQASILDGKEGAEAGDALQEIIRALPSHLNAEGYFGEPLRDMADEQQLSGHNWFLRALCAYRKMSGDPFALDLLERISKNLLLLLEPFYQNYPLGPRIEDGGVCGHLQKDAEGLWKLSTDVGCAFMPLDGITEVYEVTENEALVPLIRKMISMFRSIDFVTCKSQTHAFLSATRGILRFYRKTGDEELLRLAEELFGLYLREGMTANYANFNWFGRKDTWTEPCAVVDSIMVAQQLFCETGDPAMLTFVNRAYRNAFRRAQRPNGGAGCDSCLHEGNSELKVVMYEAPFCCTMRIAEGLKSMGEFLFVRRGDTMFLPFACDAAYEDNGHGLKIVRREEADGSRIRLEIEARERTAVAVYVPETAEVDADFSFRRDGCLVYFDVSSGNFDLKIRNVRHSETVSGRKVLMSGDDLLVCGEGGPRAIRSCLDMAGEKEVCGTAEYLYTE